jgi:hypothetical protein
MFSIAANSGTTRQAVTILLAVCCCSCGPLKRLFSGGESEKGKATEARPSPTLYVHASTYSGIRKNCSEDAETLEKVHTGYVLQRLPSPQTVPDWIPVTLPDGREGCVKMVDDYVQPTPPDAHAYLAQARQLAFSTSPDEASLKKAYVSAQRAYQLLQKDPQLANPSEGLVLFAWIRGYQLRIQEGKISGSPTVLVGART